MHIHEAKSSQTRHAAHHAHTETEAHERTAKHAEPRLLPHVSARIAARATAAVLKAPTGKQHSAHARRSMVDPSRRAQQPLEPPHRVGRSPAPLLAAAGGARRQGLLLHEKEAPCAHGHAPPRPHQAHVHLSPWRRQPRAIATAAAALRARGKGGATRSGAHMGVPIVVELMRNPTLTTSEITCGRSSSTAQRG